MNIEYAKQILEQSKSGYDAIAKDFSRTRRYPWKESIFLIKDYLKEKSKILDLGCGNGRFYELFKEIGVEYYGIDNSEELIKIAKEKYSDGIFETGDALNLTFSNSYFENVYSFAVIHHIPSKKMRMDFLVEANRVLKKEGIFILTSWNLWNKKKALKLFIKYSFLKLIGKSKLDFKDIFFPWKYVEKNMVVDRYIHLFTKKELIKLFKNSGFKILDSGIIGKKSKNYYIVGKKM